MDIIALSLGLAPVPPLPPEVVARQTNTTRESQRIGGRRGAAVRNDGPEIRAQLREWMRDTGPATALDLCTDFGLSQTNVKRHLYILQRAGEVRREVIFRHGRHVALFAYAEPEPTE